MLTAISGANQGHSGARNYRRLQRFERAEYWNRTRFADTLQCPGTTRFPWSLRSRADRLPPSRCRKIFSYTRLPEGHTEFLLPSGNQQPSPQHCLNSPRSRRYTAQTPILEPLRISAYLAVHRTNALFASIHRRGAKVWAETALRREIASGELIRSSV